MSMLYAWHSHALDNMAEMSPPTSPGRTTAPRSLSKEDYTVGWIVALSHELAVAQAMRDEEHDAPEDFEQNTQDTNNYEWGRIGSHNIVIVSLPAGGYGVALAARTASQLRTSWPHLRFGLMVGIGAGIPKVVDGSVHRDYDIRLGDVVVSVPKGTTPGVVQHDLGKIHNGRLQRVGSLDKPPAVLLTVVQTIKADYERVGSRIPDILTALYTKHPRMKREYIYQGEDQDVLLFDTPEVCDARVERPKRSPPHPEVHYGLIGSGNLVVKDAKKRAEIIKSLDDECICLETKAAGFMDTFPCLVITGICDYAYAHKNDQWQKYAAATAGAFAKELLGRLRGGDVRKTKTLEELVGQSK